MPTDEEIKTVFIRSYTGENWIHKNGFLNPTLKSWIDTMLNQARADTLRLAISHMRVARSSMCLKDRAILLNEINLLEAELKELEE